MSLNYVNLIMDLYDGTGAPLNSGYARMYPDVPLTISADDQYVPKVPINAPFQAVRSPTVTILATDNVDISPNGWAWNVDFVGVPGNPSSATFFLPFANGATQYWSSIPPAIFPPVPSTIMPYPAGIPSEGNVPIWHSAGGGTISWGAGGGGGGGGTVTPQTLNTSQGQWTGDVVISLISVTFSAAGRLRLYTNSAERTADQSRPVTNPPTLPSAAGLMYEYVADTNNTDISLPILLWPGSSKVIYWQLDGGPTVNLAWSSEGGS